MNFIVTNIDLNCIDSITLIDIIDASEEDMNNYEFTVEALGFHDGDQYCAVAVNMDIWGYGESQEEAFKDVVDMVCAQVSYAVQTDSMELIDFPAEDKYIEAFKAARFRELSQGKTSLLTNIKDAVIANLPIKPQLNHAFS